MNKKVLDYINKKIASGVDGLPVDPDEFAYVCKNILDLRDKDQGLEVEKYFEHLTSFERIAEDGISIEQVGHKGDLKVNYNKGKYYPNVKSTMVSKGLFLKSDRYRMSKSSRIKIFDSSRTADFSLRSKLGQINYDLIIINFGWDASLLQGVISTTSLKEVAQYLKCGVSTLFETNDNGHWFIKASDIFETAVHNDRCIGFLMDKEQEQEMIEEHGDFSSPSIVELLPSYE